MHTGIAVLNFGEPSEPSRDAVVDYLERIFLANASIEGDQSEADARERASELARRRAPSLIEEYEEIGGSPLNEQAEWQASSLEAKLRDRGYDVTTYTGMQYTPPLVEDAAERAHADGVDQLVGLPVYPLCGPSTTVAALEELAEATDALGWDVPTREVTGWHRHPAYARIRADNVRAYLAANDLELGEDVRFVCSAHGTPRHYLEEGSRYQRYVEEYCEVLAAMLGVETYELGYQNHENRDVPWTQPDVEDVVVGLEDAEAVVVEPVSFMHEQSETLSELDDELREEAVEAGLGFHRVPVPHDSAAFVDLLADLVEPFLAEFDPAYSQLRPCQCRDAPDAYCLNAPFDR